MTRVRVGVDMGGAKIAHAVLDADGKILEHSRVPTPRDYDATLAALVAIGEQARRRLVSQ